MQLNGWLNFDTQTQKIETLSTLSTDDNSEGDEVRSAQEPQDDEEEVLQPSPVRMVVKNTFVHIECDEFDDLTNGTLKRCVSAPCLA